MVSSPLFGIQESEESDLEAISMVTAFAKLDTMSSMSSKRMMHHFDFEAAGHYSRRSNWI